ncbi:hypothetical protein J5226_08390 [Lysobacter sp. K5869]|uniref:hypothetical protein n=1 Tax=Lysobacter sp. K5869 TaxID=2820808 RepID=UPI001C062EC7|nr:hypothetical protein [Lysobacter sp. K5869]QWP78395.1 hypothetical protein J5226_08390 [Lysobacter sp. K5869]
MDPPMTNRFAGSDTKLEHACAQRIVIAPDGTSAMGGPNARLESALAGFPVLPATTHDAASRLRIALVNAPGGPAVFTACSPWGEPGPHFHTRTDAQQATQTPADRSFEQVEHLNRRTPTLAPKEPTQGAPRSAPDPAAAAPATRGRHADAPRSHTESATARPPMSLDYKAWGTLATFGPGYVLLGWTSLEVSRDDAQAALGRAPDHQDDRATAWGRITREEAARLLRRESHLGDYENERSALIADLYGKAADTLVSLYYQDPFRGL